MSAAKHVRCPTCNARPGEACKVKAPFGRYLEVHHARRDAYDLVQRKLERWNGERRAPGGPR